MNIIYYIIYSLYSATTCFAHLIRPSSGSLTNAQKGSVFLGRGLPFTNSEYCILVIWLTKLIKPLIHLKRYCRYKLTNENNKNDGLEIYCRAIF